MLKFLTISSLFLLTALCNAQSPYIGHWENVDDKKYHVYITEKYVVEYYDEAVIDTFTYSVSNTPCDTSYKKPLLDNPTAFFLETNIHSGDNYCFELLSNGANNYLTLRYVFNGYMNEFERWTE